MIARCLMLCSLLAGCVEAGAPEAPDASDVPDAPSGPALVAVSQSGAPHTVWLSGFVTDGCQASEDRSSPDCTHEYEPGTVVRATAQLGLCADGSHAPAEWLVDGLVTQTCPAGRLTCRVETTAAAGLTVELELAVGCL